MKEALLTPGEDKIPTFDVPPMGNTFNVLANQLGDTNSSTELYEYSGNISLQRTLEATTPALVNALTYGKRILDEGVGFFLIRGAELHAQPQPIAELAALAISSFYGKPTRSSLRDPRLVWPIKYAEYVGSELTFSQTKEEASLHTDTQYFENPEPYFGLFCIASDEPGKGTSSLVRAEDVLANLIATNDNTVIDELKKSYPFKVPPIFTSSPNETVITWAPIVEDDRVRYRLDTLNAAIKAGATITDQQLEAMNVFDETLNTTIATNYHMRPGDIMFVNNYRTFHSRSEYSNPDRLLLRVRVK